MSQAGTQACRRAGTAGWRDTGTTQARTQQAGRQAERNQHGRQGAEQYSQRRVLTVATSILAEVSLGISHTKLKVPLPAAKRQQ